MTIPSPEIFEQVEACLKQEKLDSLFEKLDTYFLNQKKYAELFEISKIKIRHDLGLSVFAKNEINFPEPNQLELEKRLLEVCFRIGCLYLELKDLSASWMYLQPHPDTQMVKQLYQSIEPNDENTEELIGITLYQAAAPEFGYRLLLNTQGTCNGITYFDSQGGHHDSKVQSSLAEILIDHIYCELKTNIEENLSFDGQPITGSHSLTELIGDHPTLFENCGHHLDVTHLASAVRIGRKCESKNSIRRCLELCEYGCQLDPQLQYESDPPFQKTYLDHQYFFQAANGMNVENALKHFESKLTNSSDSMESSIALMTMVDLLMRNGRSAQAIEQQIRLSKQSDAYASSEQLIELARTEQDSDAIMKQLKSDSDVLGFTLAGIKKKQLDCR